MSSIVICDGCAAQVDAPKSVGRVLKRDYCAECEERAQAFVDAEEALRAKLYEQFAVERNLLIEESQKNGFKLPDIPNG